MVTIQHIRHTVCLVMCDTTGGIKQDGSPVVAVCMVCEHVSVRCVSEHHISPTGGYTQHSLCPLSIGSLTR